MKKIMVIGLMVLGFGIAQAAEQINVQIVYDCSGSMGANIKGMRKSDVAKDAMKRIFVLVNKFQNVSPGTDVNVGIVSFHGGDKGVIMNCNKFDGKRSLSAIERLPDSSGNTPLGDAIKKAYDGLPKIGKSHIFVITDGEENGNLKMADVIGQRKDSASLYFVAFDVNASVFDGVKNLGALVFQANDATELQNRVQIVFTQNILLEKED